MVLPTIDGIRRAVADGGLPCTRSGWTPSQPLGTAVVPVSSVPIQLSSIVLCDAFSIAAPLSPLPEMTLSITRLLVERLARRAVALDQHTGEEIAPVRRCRRRSCRCSCPSVVLPAGPPSETTTPTSVLPEMMLPAAVLPPIMLPSRVAGRTPSSENAFSPEGATGSGADEVPLRHVVVRPGVVDREIGVRGRRGRRGSIVPDHVPRCTRRSSADRVARRPLMTETPPKVLPSPADCATFKPTLFPATTFSLVPVPLITTPSSPLSEMTLPAPAVVPPIVWFVAAVSICTPLKALPSPVSLLASVPIVFTLVQQRR